MKAGLLAVVAALLVGQFLFRGCDRQSNTTAVQAESPLRFRDVAEAAGIHFPLGHAGKTPLTILDSLGQGCAFLDYDRDGQLDVMLVSHQHGALFRNLGDGHFEDVTGRVGADVPGYWHGIAAGDFDGDGNVDVCLVGYRSLALLRNDGSSFTDVTSVSGLARPEWGSSAGFADLDGDGRLDLVIGDYVEFGPQSVQYCTVADVKTACGPKIYPPRFPRVYRNHGNRFEDVTRQWGFATANGKTLGVAFGDFNGDGALDLALANDEMPQDLFLRQPGTPVRFQNQGAEYAFSFLASGRVQSGMGIDVADYNRDGTEDLIVTNFQNEPAGLYQNQGSFFEEVSAAAGVSEPTFPYVGWGVRFLDADNDGDLDLIIANGHIQDNVHRTSAGASYPEPLLLLENDGRGRYREVGAKAGPAFAAPIVGRGLASGDFDNDGRMDVLVTNIEGAPLLLQNDAHTGNHWLGLELVSGIPARPALGALAELKAPGLALSRRCTTAGSIFSAHDPRVHFGLGTVEQVEAVTVRWPDGKRERFDVPGVDRYLRIRQGEGTRSADGEGRSPASALPRP